MAVKAKITDQTQTSFRVQLQPTTSEQVFVSLYRPSGEPPFRRPVQTGPGPLTLTVLFENLEPATTYRVTVESSEATQELQATTRPF